MENADALADIADCGFVELTSAGVSVAMGTSPAAAAVVCIFELYGVSVLYLNVIGSTYTENTNRAVLIINNWPTNVRSCVYVV